MPKEKSGPEALMGAPLRATYRAIFHAPVQGILNPMGLKFNVSLEIEAYPVPDECWKLRILSPGGKRSIIDLPANVSLEGAQSAARALFQKQEQRWRMWGDVSARVADDALKHGKEYQGKARPIQPDEVVISAGKVYLKALERKEAVRAK